jgi:hypothetical protein
MERTREQIESRIKELEARAIEPGHHPTEIYTRIVGYYRSLANWNAGKREEYGIRKTFDEKISLSHQTKNPNSYILFTTPTCPNCPAMKKIVATLDAKGIVLDATTTEGFAYAAEHRVSKVPTLVVLDADNREIARIHEPKDVYDYFPKGVFA